MESATRVPGLCVVILALSSGIAVSTLDVTPARSGDPNFRDISGTVFSSCTPCHATTGLGRPRLASHGDFKTHGKSVLRAVNSRKMPPCHAFSDFGPLCKYPELSQDNRVAIERWCLFVAPSEPDSGLAAPKQAAPKTPVATVVENLGANEKVSASGQTKHTYVVQRLNHSRRFLVGFLVRSDNIGIARFARLYAVTSTARVVIGDWSVNSHDWRCPDGTGVSLAGVRRLELEVTYLGSGKEESAKVRLQLFTESHGSRQPRRLSLAPQRPLLTIEKDMLLFAVTCTTTPPPYLEIRTVGEKAQLVIGNVPMGGFPSAINLRRPVLLSKGTQIQLIQPTSRDTADDVVVTLHFGSGRKSQQNRKSLVDFCPSRHL